jgi:branched-chain amino acid transport system ATP-binding protein
MSALLEVDELRAGYGHLAVVRELCFTVDEGQVVALLGPNGAGKTTSALTISSFLPSLGGAVKVLGHPPRGPRNAHRSIRDGLGIVLDNRGLFPNLTVQQHLTVAVTRRDTAREIARVFEILPELERLRSRKAGLLSGGEQQMLAVARAIVRHPKLLIIDEMSMGLAPLIAARLAGVVRELATGEGIGVLLVEQHVELALSIADRAVVLEHGESAFVGDVRELMESHANLVRESYLGHTELRADVGPAD